MKKSLLSAAILSSLTLVGCDGSDGGSNNTVINPERSLSVKVGIDGMQLVEPRSIYSAKSFDVMGRETMSVRSLDGFVHQLECSGYNLKIVDDNGEDNISDFNICDAQTDGVDIYATGDATISIERPDAKPISSVYYATGSVVVPAAQDAFTLTLKNETHAFIAVDDYKKDFLQEAKVYLQSDSSNKVDLEQGTGFRWIYISQPVDIDLTFNGQTVNSGIASPKPNYRYQFKVKLNHDGTVVVEDPFNDGDEIVPICPTQSCDNDNVQLPPPDANGYSSVDNGDGTITVHHREDKGKPFLYPVGGMDLTKTMAQTTFETDGVKIRTYAKKTGMGFYWEIFTESGVQKVKDVDRDSVSTYSELLANSHWSTTMPGHSYSDSEYGMQNSGLIVIVDDLNVGESVTFKKVPYTYQ